MLGLPLVRIADAESILNRASDALTTFNVRADAGARSRHGAPEYQHNAHFWAAFRADLMALLASYFLFCKNDRCAE